MNRLIFPLIAFLLAFLPRIAFAQGTPAPAFVDNQARAAYISQISQPSGPPSEQGGLMLSNTVRANLKFEVPFAIVKTALTASPTQGVDLSYRIEATRQSGSIASPVALTVDHTAKTYFLITDQMPEGTVFQKIEDAPGAIILYHLRGGPESMYTATAPADLSTIDRVAAAYPDFPPGVTRGFKIALVNVSAIGTVVNTAAVRFVNKDLAPEDIVSGAANIVVGDTMPAILYYEATYQTVLSYSFLGAPLYVEVVWAAGNLDPLVVDRGQITLVSGSTGDQETFEIVETGPDTGVFRVVAPVPTRSALKSKATVGNATMETVEGDTITAKLESASGSYKVETKIRIESAGGGIVFDSKSNLPVSGAKVTIINGSTGLPATVFDFDGSTHFPSFIVTGADGRYLFPVLPAGSYRLQVEPPPGYSFTSKILPASLPSGRVIDTDGSYGYPFQRSGSEGRWFDIPCDPIGGNVGLFVDKTPSRNTVELGEALSYVVRVKNVYGSDLSNVVVSDKLPFGFRYIKGSAALEGKRIKDPKVSDASMEFPIGKIKNDETISLTYRVRVSVGAKEGDGINRAEAWDTRTRKAKSNRAEAFVEVILGVFTDKGIIIGKVYVDLNRNKIQDAGEPGIPGIRLYMEDGSYVITDNEGKYSFYGVSPRLHVIKLDNTTLPPGAKLEVLSSRNAGDAGSRFVDLTKGEMHKADFAEASGDPTVLENVMQRRRNSENGLNEITSNLQAPLQRDNYTSGTSTGGIGGGMTSGGSSPGYSTNRITQDVKSLPASGIIGVGAVPYQNGSAATNSLGLVNAADDAAMPRREIAPNTPWAGSLVGVSSGMNLSTTARPMGYNATGQGGVIVGGMGSSALTESPLDVMTKKPVSPSIPLETAMTTPGEDATLGFLDLVDGDTLTMTQTTVRVKGSAAATITLSVNGEAVPASRIGKQVTYPDTKTQGIEYIGVPLTPGVNTLELTQRDPFGNVRGQKTITLIAPGRLGKIAIETPNAEARADGKTPARVIIRLVDANGVPVSARTAVTLETSASEWDIIDLNPKEPGIQVFLEGGKGEFLLKAPLEPSDAIVRASTGILKAEAQISFLPELRPLIAVGVVEGRVDFSNLNASFGRRDSRDSFNDELKNFTLSSGNDGAEAGARTAFFIKGQITGEYVLTAAYDSEKDRKERLFRDIQPDEFYPIYGDSSLKGFDAQSTSELYAKIENKRSYLLYGDYVTQSNSDLRSLGNYSRSLTGGQYHFESKRINANVWGSYDSSRQVIQELPANGTSGPFAFRIANGLVNSEKVEVLTRARNQPSLIINTVSMARFTDYQFEPFSGRILFKAPIPSVDENLNPISIRITYEADQGGDKFWVYGADAQVRATDWLEIGGSAVDDTNPFAPYRLFSGNAAIRLEKNTFLIGEVAMSDSPFDATLGGFGNLSNTGSAAATSSTGRAERVELRHQSERLTGRLYWSRADESFRNPSATLSAGRIEAGAQIGYRINDKTNLHVEAINTESTSGGSRKGVLAEVGYSLADRVRLDIGGRYSSDSGDPYSTSTTEAPVADGSIAPVQNQADIASVRAKLTVPFPYLASGSLYGEYENDLVDIERRVASIGFEYQASKETKIYAKHEFISSLDGQFDLNSSQQKNTTVVGVQSAYMEGGQLFNEYRMRDAIDGRQSEGAIGLRNSYNVFDGLQVQASFERVAPLVIGRKTEVAKDVDGRPIVTRNVASTETTAATAAFDYTGSDDWKMTGRGEFRTSDSEDAWLFTFGYAQRLNEDQSVLGRIIYDTIIPKAEESGDRQQFRLQLGYAYRPVHINVWNFLVKYELKLESDATLVDLASNRVVHIVSGDVNWQPTACLTFSGHYAAKLASESSNGLDGTELANLIGIRALVDLSERWDAGLNLRVMFDAKGRIQYGAGPEVGFRFKKNMRLAAGYNFFGFTDRDFSADNYTQAGAYIAFNMKFDENLFKFDKAGAGE